MFDRLEMTELINEQNMIRRYKHLESLIGFYDQDWINIV